MTHQYALGPFTPQMKAECENLRGQTAPECSEENWDIFFAGVLRGTARCPVGSAFNRTLNACADDSFAYGPFLRAQVAACQSQKWAYVCETMRWPIAILLGDKAPPAPPPSFPQFPDVKIDPLKVSGLSRQLLAWYSKSENYRRVHAQVMDWFGTTRNACVAFISTALRNIGLSVPRTLNTKGYNISTWTAAFSDYLEQTHGWTRVSRLGELQPGDVVFTLDLDGSRNIPAHVFLFVGWVDNSSPVARVIDNQGFLHTRDLTGTNGNFTPFNYALRPRQ